MQCEFMQCESTQAESMKKEFVMPPDCLVEDWVTMLRRVDSEGLVLLTTSIEKPERIRIRNLALGVGTFDIKSINRSGTLAQMRIGRRSPPQVRYKCLACGAGCGPVQDVEAHVTGRKHKRAMSAYYGNGSPLEIISTV